MAGYLSGKDGAVILATVTHKTKGWKYTLKSEHVKTRAGGDRGTCRTHIASDWELSLQLLIPTGAIPTDVFALNGTDAAFDVRTDATPRLKVVGTGLVTEVGLGVDVDGENIWEVKVECSSSNGADLPAVTVA